MKELAFILSLRDKLSAPLGKAGQAVDNFANRSVASIKRLGAGFIGLWAAAKSIVGLIKPADTIESALNELSTRNVSGEALESLRKQAAKFSTDFGVSAAEFIGSVTAIRSSLYGLSDSEIPRAALAVNTLAVAMKSDSEQAAGYIADLAAQFTDDVDRMGRVHFAESFASKTAWLVRNTGQDMAKIQALLSGAKGTGTSYGVGADEQLAVLGNLGGALGSQAGGVYEAFLKNAQTGARALGMSFVDAQGKLLAFPDILDKLQHRYGDSVNGNIRLQEKLNKAFGKGAAALIKTWGNADKLRKNIKELQGTQGLSGVKAMAEKLSDSWDRLGQGGERIINAIGAALMPGFTPLIDQAIEFTARLGRWLEMFPNIARWIGYITVAILALGATAAVLTALAGLFSLISSPILFIIAALAVLAWAVYDQYKYWRWAFGEIGKDLQAFWAEVVAVWGNVVAFFSGLWGTLQQGWDTVINYFSTRSPLEVFRDYIALINGAMDYLWNAIKQGWNAVIGYFSTRSPLEVFTDFADAITGVFESLWNYLTASFGKTYNWIVSKLNKIPGVNIELKEIAPDGPLQIEAPVAPVISAPAGVTPPRIEAGGIAKTITTNNRAERATYVGEVNILPQNQETFDSLMESRELAAP